MKIKIKEIRHNLIDIKEKKEIDRKLIGWIKKAYNLHEKMK